MVHFVGAGPGAVDLITIRGERLLREADVIIYAGSLVNPALLSVCKDGAVIHDSSLLNLDQIIKICADAEREGKNTVRLHTGDPSIYGAIKEQFTELDRLGISYDVTPGVSSFQGAAASIKAEYTLPLVSQSIIITRLEGRTKVPDAEKLNKLASHGASMAVFLSAGNIKGVVEELLKGGIYTKDTCAALIYKATWPDEKVIITTLSKLSEKAKEAGITKTALILVGDFLTDNKVVERSKLYDRDFSTGYRRGKKQGTGILSFTDEGHRLSERIKEGLISQGYDNIVSVKNNGDTAVKEWIGKSFYDVENIIFIGACGIAVRMISPFLESKISDPAVIVSDEKGINVISLLSGHIGGGNSLAETIAHITGGNAVITTATDIENRFAVDVWAEKNGMFIQNPQRIKTVSAKLLKDQPISIRSEYEIRKRNIQGDRDSELICINDEKDPPDIYIGIHEGGGQSLNLCPKTAVLGIGCKKGTKKETIESVFADFSKENRILPYCLISAASIDLKKDEDGIKGFCKDHGLAFKVYSKEELGALKGEFTGSEMVKEVTGVDNVCERSALKSACEYDVNAEVLVRKYAKDGVTFALAVVRKEFEL
ncbi:MAG: precorrin-4 C(11)-methyltransferase [Lachnospiraceae bacterium]|nr:precorrin-4 C(11)-methyltransferase [Lachnospiraceae bacterium]